MKNSSGNFVLGLLSLPAVLCAAPADTSAVMGWKHTASGLVNLSQAYFDNWVKGGTDALNWQVQLSGSAALQEEEYSWESKGHGFYGENKLGDLSSRKSSDELYLETVYTRKLNPWVNPFSSASFQSQFMPGYLYTDSTRTRVSGSFDPSYLFETVGAGYEWRKELTVRAGGTLKETFSSPQYPYADSSRYEIEPGASLMIGYQKGFMENVLFNTLLNVFANFKGLKQTDVDWQNNLTAKANKYVSTSFGFEILYDPKLSTRREIKENLAVGISFLSI